MSIAKSFEKHCEDIAIASQRFAAEMRHRGLAQSYEDAIQEWKAFTNQLNQRIQGLEAKIKTMANESRELDARRAGLKAQRNAVLGELRRCDPENPLSKKTEDGKTPQLDDIYDRAYNEVMQAPPG